MMIEIGRHFAYMEPISLTLVAEAWTTKDVPPQGKRISDMPNRQECIVIIHERRAPNSYKLACTIPFTRIGKDIVLGESLETSTDDGEANVENPILLPFWLGVSSAWLEPKDTRAN